MRMPGKIKINDAGSSPRRSEVKKEKQKKSGMPLFFGIAGGILLALLLVVGGYFIINNLNNNGNSRDNIIKLVERYRDKGEYSRALDLLDSILLKNPDDDKAKKLQDEILKEKQQSEEAKLHEGTKDLEEQRRLEKQQRDEDARREKENLDRLLDSLKDKNNNSKNSGKIQPSTTDSPEIKGNKAKELLEKGKRELDNEQYANAIKTFNEVLNRKDADDKDKAAAYAYIGDAYYREDPKDPDNKQKARDNADKSMKLDPSLAQPHITLGKIDNDEKKYEMAEHEYKQATLLDSKDWLTFYSLGVIQYRMAKYNDARISFEACLKLKPDFEKAHLNLGMSYKKLDNSDKAVKEFQSAIDDKPDFFQAYDELGKGLKEKGDLNGAINAFRSAVKYSPQGEKSSSIYFKDLANAYIAKEAYADAEKALGSALSLDPDDLDSSYKMANVKYNLGKPNEGLDFAKRAVAGKPQIPEYNYQLGLEYEAMKDTDNAIKYYSKAIELDSNYANPLINLGKIYTDADLYDKALPLLLAAYKIIPDNFIVNNNLGNIYSGKEQYEDSLKYLEKAVLLKPNESKPRYNLGVAYKKLEKFTQAKNAFSDLIKLNPSYWDAYYDYALILVKEGDKSNAKMLLDTLLAKNPNYDKKGEVKNILSTL
jgi:tetratricopeptide (TPR) repeat protein